MPQTSFALMTNLGRAKEAAAIANATTIEITHIAIGDGSTVPSGGETELYNEVAARNSEPGHLGKNRLASTYHPSLRV